MTQRFDYTKDYIFQFATEWWMNKYSPDSFIEVLSPGSKARLDEEMLPKNWVVV
jgi:hypothetical protein